VGQPFRVGVNDWPRRFSAAGPVIAAPSPRACIDVDAEVLYADQAAVLPGLLGTFRAGR
jgi:hypothetical protein